ncbi:MAG: hypothetical protein JJ896_01615 [Rhodothermales bacterium]|nr:hypothetical protein [Rhodothermales bacterium]MBO6778326.1 hypothetical protein [Rhodothermales bacterium]
MAPGLTSSSTQRVVSALVVALCLAQAAYSQSQEEPYPIAVSLVGGYVIQPGIVIGTEWTMSAAGSPVVRPRIGGFSWPRDHRTLLVGADASWQLSSTLSSLTAGLDVHVESRVIDVSVSISSGDKEASRQLRLHLVPAVGYRLDWGRQRLKHLQLAVGRRLSFTTPDALFFMVQVGGTIRFRD